MNSASPRAISNVATYGRYLRARQEGWRWRRDAIDRAVRLLDEALRIEGNSAPLHTALGVTYLQYREAGIDLSERPLQQAQRRAAQVLALEPGSPRPCSCAVRSTTRAENSRLPSTI
jgi:hypothetical protein